MDAKLSPGYEAVTKKEEDLYCSPLYSDPLQLDTEATIAPWVRYLVAAEICKN